MLLVSSGSRRSGDAPFASETLPTKAAVAPSVTKVRRSDSGAVEVTRRTSHHEWLVPGRRSPKSSEMPPSSSHVATGRSCAGPASGQCTVCESPGLKLRWLPHVPVEMLAEPDVEPLNQASAVAAPSTKRMVVAASMATALVMLCARRACLAMRRSASGAGPGTSAGRAIGGSGGASRRATGRAASATSAGAWATSAGVALRMSPCSRAWPLRPALVWKPAPQCVHANVTAGRTGGRRPLSRSWRACRSACAFKASASGSMAPQREHSKVTSARFISRPCLGACT